MLVTQRGIGDETAIIEQVAPNTWRYLMEHAELTDRRASSIYRRRPRFSVFGVGEYSFRSWKVAISGFYKEMQFRIVGPVDARPAVLDDTCCFLPCESEHQARAVCELLNSSRARRFFDALLFWDAKRPVTIELLQRLDLAALAEEVGGNALRELVVGDGEGESRKHG